MHGARLAESERLAVSAKEEDAWYTRREKTTRRPLFRDLQRSFPSPPRVGGSSPGAEEAAPIHPKTVSGIAAAPLPPQEQGLPRPRFPATQK